MSRTEAQSSTIKISQEKNQQSNTNTIKNTRFPNFKLPPISDGGAPTGRRKGGAGRPECPAAIAGITALVPGVGGKSVLASTVAENSSYWVYIPQLPKETRYGEFVLQEVSPDGDEEDIFRTRLTLPEKSGIIGITPPQKPQYLLKEGNKYHMYFKVYCGNPEEKPEYFYVDAWIQRVRISSQLKSQLKGQPEDYVSYAKYNIWQDTISNLAELRSQSPQNQAIKRDWVDLLTAVGLEEVTQAEIVKRYYFQE
ncbi:MAG: DUF928 domain-containing protein [Mastigocoleus sp.]